MVVLEPRACPAPSPRGGGTPQAQSRRFHTNVRREKAMIFPSVYISMFRAKRAPPEASRETAIASSHRAELGRVSAPKPATGPPGPPGLTQTHPAEAGGIRHTREGKGGCGGRLPPATPRIVPPLTWGTLLYRTQGLRQSRDVGQLTLIRILSICWV